MSKRRPTAPPTHRKPLAEELEARLLFSADAAAVVAPVEVLVAPDPGAGEAVYVEHPAGADPAAGLAAEAPPGREIAFVDAGVDGYEALVEDLRQRSGFEVVVLDADRSGLDQISEVLAARVHDVEAVHVVSHGEAGAVQLGDTWLTNENVTSHAETIAAWGSALGAEADLLFYGCDLAGGASGLSLVDSLAALTGADVAASADATGHALLGGDWALEVATGQIDTEIAFSAELQQGWSQLMAVGVDNTSTATAVNTTTINSSHVTSGSDRLMIVSLSFEPNGTESVSSITYNGATFTNLVGSDQSSDGTVKVEVWSLLAPPTSGTDTVAVTFDGLVKGVAMGVVTFTDVDQTTPLSGFSSTPGDSDAASTTVTSNANELVFGFLGHRKGVDNAPGAGQSETFETAIANVLAAGSIENGATSTVTSWNLDAFDKWVATGVSIKSSTPTVVAALSPVQDASIDEGNPTTNNGSAGSMTIDREGGDKKLGLVQFDLSSIPAGSTITNATLRLESTSIGGELILEARELLESWVEGSTTWNNWTTPGGVYSGTVLDTLTTDQTGQHSFDLTSLAQAWLSGASTNNGVIFGQFIDGGNREATYDTREGTTPPILEIAYTPPASNTAPTLDSSKSPVLAAVDEDAGAPSGAVGTLVSSLVDFAVPSGEVDNVADPDGGAQLGIAITGANTASGAWWYSTNDGGTWAALGSPSTANARLLSAEGTARVYFQPNADFNGTLPTALTFRAWDQTAGSDGDTADTTTNGGTTAFSTATDTASLVVNAINDAPTLGNGSLAAVNEDTASPPGASISALFGAGFGDIDSGSSFSGIAIVGNTAPGSEGAWQYSSDGGTTWANVGTVGDDATALAVQATSLLRFLPAADFEGTPTDLVLRGLDDSYAGSWSTTPGVESRVNIDTTTSGGTTEIAGATSTLSTTIDPINDAPTLGDAALTAVPEDGTNPPGATLLALFGAGFGDVDSGASFAGVAIVGNMAPGAEGIWQYSSDGGTTWAAVGIVGDGATALAVQASSMVRFLPAADYNGTPADLVLRGLDDTYAGSWSTTAGSETRITVDTTSPGGTTSIAGATSALSTSVYAINDAPTLGDASLAAVDEDAGNPPGATFSALFGAGFGDIDAGASFAGVAIVGNTAPGSEGTWQYSSDGGTSWAAVGAVGDGPTALAVQASSLVRFLPAADYNGTPTDLVLRGLDDSYAGGWSTTAGSETRVAVNTTATGGTTPIAASTSALSTAINAINDAPTLGNGSLAAVDEDTASPPGATVSALFGAGFGDSDAGSSFSGIALVGNTAPGTEGSWQYSSDGGTTWADVGTVGDDATALAVQASSLLRFLPAADYNGTPTDLVLRGLDDTYAGGWSTTAGSETRVNVNTTTSGGITEITAATSTLSTSINAINDAPTLGNGSLAAVDEDTASPPGATVSALFGAGFGDSDAGSSFSGIALVGNTAPGTEGAWQYSSDGGTTWANVGTVGDDATALAVQATSLLRFLPAADYNGTPTDLVLRGLDDTYAGGWSTTAGSETRVNVNTTTSGGITEITAATSTLSTSINAINDAPTLGNGSLAAVDEDTANPPGATVSALFGAGFGDVDAGSSFSGVAIVGNTAPGTEGAWQYSSDGGTTWADVGTVGDDATALAVQGTSLLRFLPAADYNGTPTDLVLRGLDDTYAGGWSTTAGSETRVNLDTSAPGGTTEIAGATSILSTAINSVNDAPTIANTASGQTMTDKATLTPFGPVTLGDVDGDVITVDVRIDDPAKGTLSGAGFTDLGGGVYRFTGTAGAATTAIRALVFDPTENRVAVGAVETSTFTIDADDATAPVVSNALTSVDTTSINDAPMAATVTLSVPENSPLGTVVGSAAGSDVDPGDPLSYAITAGNTGGAFMIDPATGEIRVADPLALDFETNPVFTLTVQVSDAALASDTGTATVNVGDVAENPVTDPPPAPEPPPVDDPPPGEDPVEPPDEKTGPAVDPPTPEPQPMTLAAASPPAGILPEQARPGEAPSERPRHRESARLALLVETAASTRETIFSVDDAMLRALDLMGVEMSDADEVMDERIRIAVGAMQGSAAAVTAGFLSWFLRGGTLLTGLLTSLPMWSRFDPLPVLDAPIPEGSKDEEDAQERDARQLLDHSGPEPDRPSA